MAIRTPEQYVESIRDGRVVYTRGERVWDVTDAKRYPHVGASTRLCCVDYAMGKHPDPKIREILNTTVDGEEVSFVFVSPKSAADLLRRKAVINGLHRYSGNTGSAKLTGVDGINGLAVAVRRIDAAHGTNYGERFAEFRKNLWRTDPAVALCMTDVKGDRSKRPSQQVPHKDFYLRKVGETKEGIIVRGAKAHISWAAQCNEMVVLPCRAMTEADKDYAIAFAISPATKGITMICQPYGVASDALVVFDDVLIPHERVFLNGEWDVAFNVTYMFANFHRLTADTYKYSMLQELAGTALLLAESLGIERKPHVIDKLTWLAAYAETAEALSDASCYKCVTEPGTDLVYPYPMYSNLAKLHFANGYHEAIKRVQDLGGGILATMPGAADIKNPETGPLIEKYLSCAPSGLSADKRLKLLEWVNENGSGAHLASTLHAEGSLEAQKVSIYANADWARYKAMINRRLGFTDGSEHPYYEGVPLFDEKELPI